MKKTPVIAGLTQEVESLLHSIGRYTKFVHSTKLMLAVLAVLLTAMVLFYPFVKKEAGIRIAFTSVTKKGPSSETQMLNARFHGLDKDNQPYNVTAKTATQVDDNTVLLDHPTGDQSLNNGGWFSIASQSGVYAVDKKALNLQGSVEMFDNDGYEFRTQQMHFDLATKIAVTHVEIRGQGPLGTLRALGGATMDGNTQVTDFAGPVFVTLYPSQQKAAQTDTAEAKRR